MRTIQPPSPSRHRRKARSWKILPALIVLSLELSLEARGQALQDPTPAPAAPAIPSADVLRARMKELGESTGIEESLRTRLTDQYRQAIDQLTSAAEARAKAEQFERMTAEAPALLATVRDELSRPVSDAAPDPPPGATFEQLEQMLAQFEAELVAAQSHQNELSKENERRTEARLRLPELLVTARRDLQKLQRDLAAPPPPEENPELAQIRRTALLAQRIATEAEIALHEKELQCYEARGDLLSARRQLAARRVSMAEKVAKAWREIVNKRRSEETGRQAREARRTAMAAHPAIRQEAQTNTELAEARSKLSADIKETSELREQAKRALENLHKSHESLRQRVEVAGLRNELGLLLRRERARLPDHRRYRSRMRTTNESIAESQIELIEIDEELKKLDELDARIEEILGTLSPAPPDSAREEIALELRSLLETRRSYLESLERDYDTYFTLLVDLRVTETQVLERIGEIRDYIDRRVLWIRSATLSDFLLAPEGVLWFLSPAEWRATGEALRDVVGDGDGLSEVVLFGLAFLIVLFFVPSLRQHLRDLRDAALQVHTHRAIHTVSALAITLVLAGLWPALMLFMSRVLASSPGAPDLARAAASGLSTAALVLFTLEVLRQISKKDGLGAEHFGWRPRNVLLLQRHLRWFLPLAVPAVFLVGAAPIRGEAPPREALGRVAFIALLVACAVFVQRVLRPAGGMLQETLTAHPSGWLSRLRYVWFPLAAGAPFLLAVLAAAGYYYSAYELSKRLLFTLWAILGIVLLRALVLRWMLILRRRLAIEQARARRAALLLQAESTRPAGSEAPEIPAASAEQQVDLGAVNIQTAQLVRVFGAVAFLVSFWLIWVDVLPALGILNDIRLGWTKTVQTLQAVVPTQAPQGGDAASAPVSSEQPVTLGDLLLAIAIGILTVIAAKNLRGLLQLTVLQRLPLDSGARYAVSTVACYLVMLLGLIATFHTIGVGWSKVQWLAAALTVGLGFGLQEIFANFVSGLIILFERPVRVGDTVTVGDVSGTVSQIRIRATVITDWDRKELLVPNKEFITGRVVNWTLTDPITRVTLRVGAAYGSDTSRATDILVEAAAANPLVLDDPKPRAYFMNFGESTLDFELRVFVRSVEDIMKVRHDLNTAIDQAFRDAGIEIAFPQRDLHIRTLPAPALLGYDAPPKDGEEVRPGRTAPVH